VAIQFLSYEGVIAAGVGGAASGMTSTDVGVAEVGLLSLHSRVSDW
jgi:hypothetical protein